MTYHKFCANCKGVLTIEEMENNICNECREKQIKEMQAVDKPVNTQES